jgi:excisionase family DNA binding protein
MANMDGSLHLTVKEVLRTFSDPRYSAKFPPVLTVDQAAELLQVPKLTIYDWRSRGLLHGCCRRVGKHLRFFRDRLLLHVFNGGLGENAG